MRYSHCPGFTRLVLGVVTGLMILTQIARAGFVFGEPTKVSCPGVSEVANPQISRDGLEMYFESTENGCSDIWVMRRSSIQEDWRAPVKLDPPVNSAWPEGSPCISPDGLELYFCDSTYFGRVDCEPFPSGYGEGDLWVCRRAATEDPWGDPENLGPMFNTKFREEMPCLAADGLSLYFASFREDGLGFSDLYVATRASTNEPWGPPENLGELVNSEILETTPFISPDGLSLFFGRGNPATLESYRSDAYVSQRRTRSSPWGPPVLFTPVQMPGLEFTVSYVEDESVLYFANSDNFLHPFDLWKVEVTLVLDFTGNGKVDGDDAFLLALNWGDVAAGPGTSPYDIAPFPWGDGTVDGRDLLVLAEHMVENIEDSNDADNVNRGRR